MPTYEYLCESCGYKFEKFQQMSDSPIKKCPECGESVKRLIGKGMGIIFKGAGFYATDHKNRTSKSQTCCGRDERCDKPPCSDEGRCTR
ncbi:MAG: zinc ribbon domain-containing protein [Candidatus Saelkia tenebricola]|nr:zinc ribbon domain-containing protein [Candidatus Saelkia tenebricola]